MIGFGATSEGASSGTTVLREVDVNAVNHFMCNFRYGGNIDKDVMFCAGVDGGGKDSCQGDSGGPIMTAEGVQVGVVSFVSSCIHRWKAPVLLSFAKRVFVFFRDLGVPVAIIRGYMLALVVSLTGSTSKSVIFPIIRPRSVAATSIHHRLLVLSLLQLLVLSLPQLHVLSLLRLLVLSLLQLLAPSLPQPLVPSLPQLLDPSLPQPLVPSLLRPLVLLHQSLSSFQVTWVTLALMISNALPLTSAALGSVHLGKPENPVRMKRIVSLDIPVKVTLIPSAQPKKAGGRDATKTTTVYPQIVDGLGVDESAPNRSAFVLYS